MKEIKFEEIDEVGEDTLDVINDADKFNAWMYQTVKPHCKGKILEIGSGIGNISQFFLEDEFPIMLTDIRNGYADRLEKKFSNKSSFLGTKIMDLTDPDFDTKFADQFGQYDTVFALNVVEHIYNDTLAIANSKKLLSNNGHLIILVPSYQKLFCDFDVELGHYRRYTKSSLESIFKENDFDIQHKQYFNFIGIFGWFVTGKLMKKKTIPKGQMTLFNTLVPLFRLVDKVIFNSMGLSTIVVGKK